MSIRGEAFIHRFEQYCPLDLAEEGDPVGLHIGTLQKDIERIMVTLDIRPEVVSEAVEKKIDLIIAKHPPIFRPIKRLTTDYPQHKMYADLLSHDIAVYTAHTNLDIVPNGLNDWLCELLGIHDTKFLHKTHTVPYQKLAVHVPIESGEEMRTALHQAGAGHITEKYADCSFTLLGHGRFTPKSSVAPLKVKKSVEQEEEKIEVVFPKHIRKDVISTMLKVHPYDEPIYEVYGIDNYELEYGIGRVGELKEKISLLDFIDHIKDVFEIEGVRLVSNETDKEVHKVAICGGSGEKFYAQALKHEADLYITGDVYYHTAHDMLADDISVVDPGHYIESICKPKLIELFEQWREEEQWEVEFIESTINTNPFHFY